jgi:hypothetical protein
MALKSPSKLVVISTCDPEAIVLQRLCALFLRSAKAKNEFMSSADNINPPAEIQRLAITAGIQIATSKLAIMAKQDACHVLRSLAQFLAIVATGSPGFAPTKAITSLKKQ